MTKNPRAEGASSSLNKTITELIGFTGKRPKNPDYPLRKKLHQMLAALAEKWMKKGFNRGHKESLKAFKTTGKVPSKLAYKGARTLFPGQKRSIQLKSAVKSGKP